MYLAQCAHNEGFVAMCDHLHLHLQNYSQDYDEVSY
jgi:hypothetical protein